MICLYLGRVKMSIQSTTVVVMKYSSSSILFIFFYVFDCFVGHCLGLFYRSDTVLADL